MQLCELLQNWDIKEYIIVCKTIFLHLHKIFLANNKVNEYITDAEI